MGSGKTLVGQTLARMLKRPFLDLDHLIEAEAGMRIGEIFDKEGEQAFRERESKTLAEVARSTNQVIATGGGTLVAHRNRLLMKETGWVVALNTPLEEISRRLKDDQSRPLIRNAQNRENALSQLFAARAPLYEEADYMIDTSRLSPEDVAKKIMLSLPSDT